MTPEERKRAWQEMPEEMRNEIVSLYNAHWITVNTRKKLERIFGAENLKTKVYTEPDTTDNVKRPCPPKWWQAS